MADPTPAASGDFAQLPGQPLGLWTPLSGLGQRLQRTHLLGERSLSILDTNLKSPLGAIADSRSDPLGMESPPAIAPDLSRSVLEGTALDAAVSPGEILPGEMEAIAPPPSPSSPAMGNEGTDTPANRRRPRQDHPGTLTNATDLAARLPGTTPTPPIQRLEVRGDSPRSIPTYQRPSTPATATPSPRTAMPPRAQRMHPGTLSVPPALTPPPAPPSEGTGDANPPIPFDAPAPPSREGLAPSPEPVPEAGGGDSPATATPPSIERTAFFPESGPESAPESGAAAIAPMDTPGTETAPVQRRGSAPLPTQESPGEAVSRAESAAALTRQESPGE
ncbi:MAG: hypothetical protein O3C67_09535, partial [Cyanobacteria bacterium]|nr:hypothetical protein [Cyanobacteriota bacterium]